MSPEKDCLKLPFTRVFNIKSEYNGELYSLFVRVPDDYDRDEKTYPILIVLDPNFLFSALYGVSSVAQNYIICGIGHNSVDFFYSPKDTKSDLSKVARSRDFLPFALDRKIFNSDTPRALVDKILQCTGKANDYMLFITNQIISFLKINFRTHPGHTIIGHSFGGVFVCFALLKYPEVFTNYIAISPMLDSRYYVEKDMFGHVYTFSDGLKRRVYMAIGSLENDDRISNYLQKLEKECRKITDHEKITGKFELIEGEDHASVALSGMLRGFKFISTVS